MIGYFINAGMKNRASEFWHFAKLLMETVHAFGVWTEDTK